MSIAINIKVNDGVVLAADSAAAFLVEHPDAQTRAVANVYNNANKVFNLVKGLPIGMITWGAGSIGGDSIETLAKDLRRKLTQELQTGAENPSPFGDYTIRDIAQELKTFMFDERYSETFADVPREKRPPLGFVVAGYSTDETMAEEYQLQMYEGELMGPDPVRDIDATGLSWHGETTAIARLVLGVDPDIRGVLQERLGVPEEQINSAFSVIQQSLNRTFAPPSMPVQDAIDLGRFLVDLTIKYHHFLPGAPTVGGQIEIAAVTKHEDFKWVERKHYYSRELNPEG